MNIELNYYSYFENLYTILIFCFCYWKIIILKTVDYLIIVNNRVVMEKNFKKLHPGNLILMHFSFGIVLSLKTILFS